MLNKLAYRNLKRSIKDYLIYFITITMAFSLIFAFNFVSFSPELVKLSKLMINLKFAVIFVNIIIVFVIGWLINYTMQFMLSKRGKEFGTYMVLGIEKKDINKLFLRENILLGIIAFILAFFIGIILSNILTFIVMNLFNMPFKIDLYVGLLPLLLTVIYFILIYIVVLFKNYRKINKMKVYDLIYSEKKNEKKKNYSSKKRTILFFMYIILGIIGVLIIDKFTSRNIKLPMGFYILSSFTLIVISIYGITFTLGDFFLSIVLKNKKIKYNNTNLFIARNISSKFKTIGFTLGTLSFLTIATLVSINFALFMKSIFDTSIDNQCPYDITVDNYYSESTRYDFGVNDHTDIYMKYDNYIERKYHIDEKLEYSVYTLEKEEIKNYIKDDYNQFDTYLKLSDYNKLLSMLNMKKLTLNNNQYYIVSNNDYKKDFKNIDKIKPLINIGNIKLNYKGSNINDYRFAFGYYSKYIIIVPDNVVSSTKVLTKKTVYETNDNVSSSLTDEINSKIGEIIMNVKDTDGSYYEYKVNAISTRKECEEESKTALTMVCFTLIYLGFIFITVVGTILSIQTLSDISKYKYRYKVLDNLGMEKKDVLKSIKKQIRITFIFPVIYPLILSVIASIEINKLFNEIVLNEYTYLYTLLISILVFGFIYFIYYLMTYFMFKQNIEE